MGSPRLRAEGFHLSIGRARTQPGPSLQPTPCPVSCPVFSQGQDRAGCGACSCRTGSLGLGTVDPSLYFSVMHIVQMMMLLWFFQDSKKMTCKHNFLLYQPQGVSRRKEVCKVWEALLEASSPSFLPPSRTRRCQVPTLISGQP